MPLPIVVELVEHRAGWAAEAAAEGKALRDFLGNNLLMVQHVGSTAIPGIVAKPILDLLPVVGSLSIVDGQRQALDALGY